MAKYNLPTLLTGLENGAAALGNSWAEPQEVQQRVITHSDIVLLDPNPRKIKTHVHTKTCPRMFLIALFVIAKIRKQPKCPNEWMNQTWDIHTRGYY